MSCTDPIADFLTTIRNGLAQSKPNVTVPFSNVKQGICAVLLEEGYITRFDVMDTKPAKTINVGLKYGQDGEPAIHEIDRISTPGRRSYAGAKTLRPVLRGLGISILTTSQGIVSDRGARKRKIGGEVICVVK